ncbi:MAG: NAD(P)-binding domain-containing protein [Acidobacteriota bacterium]
MSEIRPLPDQLPAAPSAQDPAPQNPAMEGPADVTIVGAGPIGIELAVALRGLGLKVVHLEAGNVGETIAWYAPQTRFFSSPERIAIAGVPLVTVDQSKATREEYLAYLRSVVQQFRLPIHSGRRVVRIERGDPSGDSRSAFQVISEGRGGPQDRRVTHTAAVILAIGDMHAPQTLGIPGEDLPHVSHYFQEPHRYFQRRVLLVGGKNSAIEAAIRCYRAGARVTLSYRGPELDEKRIKYWLMPEIRALIRDGSIRFLPSTTPLEIDARRVLLKGPEGQLLEEPAQDVLLMTGYVQDNSLFRQTGIQLEGEAQAPHHDEDTMETNVPGLYVAGTAVAGTQLGGVQHFIETSHVHVQRIAAHLAGRRATGLAAPVYELPES